MRRIAALGSALALTVSLAACGGTTEGSATGADANEAATNLVALAKQVGDRTAESSTAHMVFTGGAGEMQVKGEGDMKLDGSDPAISMDMDAGGMGKMAVVLLDGVFYMKLPQGLSPGDKPWIKIDSKDKSNPMAQALGSLTDQMRQNADPRLALEQFKESGTIESSAKEDLNGEQTTHYKINVDVQKLADTQDDPTLKQAMQQAIKSGLKDFPVDLWTNADGLPVRMIIDMPTADPTSGKAVPVKVQVDYTKWGEPVDIQAPPADQVGEFPGTR
ncbi:MAG TPA: hypothetical protein VH969_15285 [Actinophytocola sp.]|jgi:hypothetical protein|uniref:hypothetical protein n=1 Tax=Actinophytocola sp. TaxID=1872138 RepID=UPI002F9207F1